MTLSLLLMDKEMMTNPLSLLDNFSFIDYFSLMSIQNLNLQLKLNLNQETLLMMYLKCKYLFDYHKSYQNHNSNSQYLKLRCKFCSSDVKECKYQYLLNYQHHHGLHSNNLDSLQLKHHL